MPLQAKDQQSSKGEQQQQAPALSILPRPRVAPQAVAKPLLQAAPQPVAAKPSRPPAERLLEDLLEATRLAALALIHLQEPDAVLGLYQYCTQVFFTEVPTAPLRKAGASLGL